MPLGSGLHCITYKKIEKKKIPPPPPKCKFSLFSSSLKPSIVCYRKCELKGTDIPPAQRERRATFCPCCIINGTMFLCCRWLRASKAYSRPWWLSFPQPWMVSSSGWFVKVGVGAFVFIISFIYLNAGFTTCSSIMVSVLQIASCSLTCTVKLGEIQEKHYCSIIKSTDRPGASSSLRSFKGLRNVWLVVWILSDFKWGIC